MSGFVRDWQKKLGYRKDPFVESPSERVKDYLVARPEEQERLNLFTIKQHRFGLMHGAGGMGKTTLFRWLEEQLKDQVVLVSTKKSRKEFVSALLHAGLSIVERTVTKPQEKLRGDELHALLLRKLAHRSLLILVDDAGELASDQKHLLRQILESCTKVQLVLAVERQLKEYEQYGADHLDLAVKEMSDDQLGSLLQRRIELAGGSGTWPFDEKEIAHLIGQSKRSPVRLLQLARDRAIELSLKVQGPPPKVKHERKRPEVDERPRKAKQQEKAEGNQPVSDQTAQKGPPQKRRWFSFKLVRNDEEKVAYEKSREREDELDETILSPGHHTVADAEALGELVQEASGEEKESLKKGKEEEFETVISSLAQEMETHGPIHGAPRKRRGR